MDNWEEELNKALQEGRRGNEVGFAEWLDDALINNDFTLEDKIRQMPYIKDLAYALTPRIEIGDGNGVVNIIYDYGVGRHPYIYLWAEERKNGRPTGKKFITWDKILRDLLKDADWPMVVRKQAKTMLKEVANADIFRTCTIKLIITRNFYDPCSSAYFLDREYREE